MLLEVQKLIASYGEDTKVLNGLSLHVKKGETIALIGPNGAGKSTVLKAIMNIGGVKISSGNIVHKDNNITRLKTSTIINKGLSYIPQSNAVFPSLSVEENLKVAFHTITLDRKTALGFLYDKYPILADKKSRMASSLSGGERQILGLARALIGRPELILLDEPSIGLSPKLGKEVFERIAKLKEHNTAVILVEQRVKEALSIADRTYLMKTGRILIEGKSSDVRDSGYMKKAYLGG